MIQSLLVPCMHTSVPEHQSRLEFLLLLLAIELLEKKAELLAERVKALPPVAAAVLVLVADENLVQKFLNIAEHGDLM